MMPFSDHSRRSQNEKTLFNNRIDLFHYLCNFVALGDMMSVDETIGTGLKIILELIGILNPSELERLERTIRERKEEIAEKKQKLLKAVAEGDADTINLITFGE